MDSIRPPTPMSENCARKSANSSACSERKYWKRIFSKVPCKKSRLDARTAAALAGRSLRANPGVDDGARQSRCGADVPTGGSEPRELLSLAKRTSASRRGRGGAIHDPTNHAGNPAPVRFTTRRGRVTPSRQDRKSEAGGAYHAGGQSAGDSAALLRGDHGLGSRVGSVFERGQPDEGERRQSTVGG